MESSRHASPQNDGGGKESKPKFDLEEVSQDITPELPGAEDVDAAFENMTTGALEQEPARKDIPLSEQIGPIAREEHGRKLSVNEVANNEALRAIDALSRSAGAKELTTFREDFLEKLRAEQPEADEQAALRQLAADLRQYYSLNIDLEKKELAADILALRQELGVDDMESNAGKELLAKIEGGEITDVVEAMNAYQQAFEDAKKEGYLSTEVQKQFEKIHKAIAELEAGGRTQGAAAELANIEESEVDDLFGGLEAGTEKKPETGLEDVTDKDVDDLFDNIQKTGTE